MLKYILYIIIIPLLSISTFLPASGGDKGDILSTRAGEHRDFHRLVIELGSEAGYRTKKTGRTIEVSVLGIESKGFSGGNAGTDLFRLTKVSTKSDGDTPVTSFFVELKQNMARVRYWTMDKPYRIVVDMYPEKAHTPAPAATVTHSNVKKSHLAGKSNFVKPKTKKNQEEKFTLKPYSKEGKHTLLYNKGWRWRYRVATVQRLTDYYYGNIPDPALDTIGEYLPITHLKGWTVGMDAVGYLRTLTEEGQMPRARTLQDIILLIKKDVSNTYVETDLLSIPENGLTPMVHFLIASSYEREGLYPEAMAFYGMAYEAKSVKKLHASAALGRGRVLFFSGRVSESREWFKKARKDGSKEAAAWLADSLFLKGELKTAWSYYEKLDNFTDPLSLMGLADLKMMRGDYKGAGIIFKGLGTRFRGQSLIESFFALRETDTILAGGNIDEAVTRYTKIQKRGDGEGAAMAMLALADYYSHDDHILIKSRDLYREVAGARTIGSSEALLSLAGVLEDLKEHGEAMKALDDFFILYPFATGAEMMGLLRSKTAYNWLKELYKQKKWLEVVTVNYRYGHWISFGKRAENFLRVGEALYRVGLTPDAVMALGKAGKIGRRDIRVKANLSLARIYLDQRDFNSAAKLLEDTRGISSAAENASLWAEYYIETQYLKGNYKEVISLGSGRTGANCLLMRAGANKALGRWREAKALYSRAIKEYKKINDRAGLLEAKTGYGDALFISGGYAAAAVAYSEAAAMADNLSLAADRWARYRLSLSYAGAGMDEEAVRAVSELKKKYNSYGEWAEALTIAQNRGQ